MTPSDTLISLKSILEVKIHHCSADPQEQENHAISKITLTLYLLPVMFRSSLGSLLKHHPFKLKILSIVKLTEKEKESMDPK